LRLHLGHHFYGAGNLGDDLMLAGFLAAMWALGVRANYTASVPFDLGPMRRRFPEVEWLPYDSAIRRDAIARADAWVGLGGSPFQASLSRWFVDHLIEDAATCRAAAKPMFYLGVGVQMAEEAISPDVRHLCAQAVEVWTRDPASAQRLAAISAARIRCGSDFAHVLLREQRPPAAQPGRLSAVLNFDYGDWPSQDTFLQAIDDFAPADRVWLAQEARDLPGAERAIFAGLPPDQRARWQFSSPDVPGTPVRAALARWPSGEWLVTARFHSALVGLWAGSKVVVIATNEKLRGVAADHGLPTLSPSASKAEVLHALNSAQVRPPPVAHADLAVLACRSLAEKISG
jgi:polysaccharide pyruvyl transferase WcaK-like protein